MGLIGKKTKQLSHRNEQSVQVSSSADKLGEKHNTVIQNDFADEKNRIKKEDLNLIYQPGHTERVELLIEELYSKLTSQQRHVLNNSQPGYMKGVFRVFLLHF